MCVCFFFSSRRRHTRWTGDWSSDVCSSDLASAWVAPKEWTEERGPTIKVSAALTIRNGILLQIGARPRRHEEWDAGMRSVGMHLVRPGQTPHYDEKTFDGGFPINTWALVAFVDERGLAIGEPHHIGRFVVI